MAIEYSSIETIESYDSVFIKFNKKSEEYNSLDNHSKLIILVAGLGLTNSIHERFIKSIIYEYTKIHDLSQRKKDKLVKLYKSPKGIRGFVNLFKLDLQEAFDLKKLEIPNGFLINSVDNLINNYLHGDFNFDDDIMFEVFKDNILDFQKIHSFTLKITRYSFVKNLSNLPDISSMI